MRRALFVGLAFLFAGVCGAQAQKSDAQRAREYQVAAENNIVFYANIWDCKTPNALQALADTQREIQQVQSMMDDLLAERQGFFVTVKQRKKEDLNVADYLKYTALEAILARLQGIADGLSKLPACPEPPKRASAKFQWTGFYVGGGGGGIWDKGTWTTTEVISLGVRDPLVDQLKNLYKANPFLGLYIGYLFNVADFLGFGPSVGLNYCPVCDEFYFGPEYGLDWMNVAMDPGIPGTGAIGTAAVRSNDSVTVKANWDMTLRMRLGYLATPSTMLFAAGGAAWMHEEAKVNCTAAGVCGTNGIPPFTQSNSTTKVGWTAGGGVEQQIWGNWHGRLEYRYSDYGKWSTSFGAPANLFVASDIKLHTQSVMAGLSYAFGGR